MKNRTEKTVVGAVIAAAYAVLSIASSVVPSVGGVFQFRISECLTILPVFTPAAVPGLFIGCLLSNALLGAGPYDVIFGSLATLLGALGTYLIGKSRLKGRELIALLPPILANTLIMPFVIARVSGTPEALSVFMLSVGIEELINCGILGFVLLKAVKRLRLFDSSHRSVR